MARGRMKQARRGQPKKSEAVRDLELAMDAQTEGEKGQMTGAGGAASNLLNGMGLPGFGSSGSSDYSMLKGRVPGLDDEAIKRMEALKKGFGGLDDTEIQR